LFKQISEAFRLPGTELLRFDKTGRQKTHEMYMMLRGNPCCVQKRFDNPLRRALINICLVLVQKPEKDTSKLYQYIFYWL
jgi:hypothetical protein